MVTDRDTTYVPARAATAQLGEGDTAEEANQRWRRDLRSTPRTAVEQLFGKNAAEVLALGIPLWSLLEPGADLGLAPATRRRVEAFRVLVERLSTEPRPRATAFRAPADIAAHCAHLAVLPFEQCHALALDPKLRLITSRCLNSGGINATTIDLPELLRFALEVRAHGLIVVHNHPSGDPTPSKADRELTTAIAAGANAVGLQFHDHVVIGSGRAYSFTSGETFDFRP